MLFGFSYLYGTTGVTKLVGTPIEPAILAEVPRRRRPTAGSARGSCSAIVMLMAGFAFKIAAVPLHFYAGDVYQGAATPVTAFLSFVPKTSGFVAIIKMLYAVGGGPNWSLWNVPRRSSKLLWILAGADDDRRQRAGPAAVQRQARPGLQLDRPQRLHAGRRRGADSRAATAGPGRATPEQVMSIQSQSLAGVLFYLAAYGIMNAGAFGVLMLLPA